MNFQSGYSLRPIPVIQASVWGVPRISYKLTNLFWRCPNEFTMIGMRCRCKIARVGSTNSRQYRLVIWPVEASQFGIFTERILIFNFCFMLINLLKMYAPSLDLYILKSYILGPKIVGAWQGSTPSRDTWEPLNIITPIFFYTFF